MDTPNTETPGIGHNMPSSADALQDRTDQLAATCNAWLQQVKKITTPEQAAKADDLKELLKAELKEVESVRTAEKRPHLDANIAIDQTYNPIKAKLQTIQGLFAPLRTAWLKKLEAERLEAERKANEEAMRKLQEAEDARKAAEDAAAALATSEAPTDIVGATIEAEDARKAADQAVEDAHRITKSTVGVQGNYSARKSSLRTTYHAEITDYAALLAHVTHEHPRVKAALDQIAADWARSPEQRKTAIPGVTLNEDQKAA